MNAFGEREAALDIQPSTTEPIEARARVAKARAAFQAGRTKPLAWRRAQLEALIRMMQDNASAIQAAMMADLGKSDVDAHVSEVLAVMNEARLMLRSLRRWTADRRVTVPLAFGLARAAICREPLGTVLVIGPWNYPFHLLFVPLIGAIAAGNAVVLKPSEITASCSQLVAEMVPRYLDQAAIQVVEGGVEATSALLECPFDHIFYTGSGPVGSIVMAAAARRLTPVTLELGGKSPAWVDASASVERAARALAWAKFSNCGQTCVAPDYILTVPDVVEPLLAALKRQISEMYGSDPKTSGDYGRIVSKRHATRLVELLGSGRAAIGGEYDMEARYIAPTVLVDMDPDAPIMREEIFGPILPIVVVPDIDAAIEHINAGPKPLALYAFSQRKAVRDQLAGRTSSGSIAFNTAAVQVGVPSLPFGGVGASGMGRYHGEFSVSTFSHEKAVFRKMAGPDLTSLTRPPFSNWLRKRILSR